jgi:hypothetical protein
MHKKRTWLPRCRHWFGHGAFIGGLLTGYNVLIGIIQIAPITASDLKWLLFFIGVALSLATWYALALGNARADEDRTESATRHQQAIDSQAIQHADATARQAAAHDATMQAMKQNHSEQMAWLKRIAQSRDETEKRDAQPVERMAMHAAVSLATSAVTATPVVMPMIALPAVVSSANASPDEREKMRRLYERLKQVNAAPPSSPAEQAAVSSSLSAIVTGRAETPPPGLIPLAIEPPKGSR